MMKSLKTVRCPSGHIYRRLLPVLVWVGAVVCVGILLHHRSRRFSMIGIAQGRMHQVCAPVDSRLKVVFVGLFEEVNKGQSLAALDETSLNAQMDTIRAEIDQLASQIVSMRNTMLAEAVNRQTDIMASQRRFDVDVENARLGVLEFQALIETDRVTAESLDVDVKIAAELLEKDAVAPYELQKARALYNVAAKRIEENENLLAQARQDLEQARDRRDEFVRRQREEPSVDKALETIHTQITVQEKRIAELALQREALRITSPAAGTVVQIQIRANQTALRRPGEDVLRQPGEVVLAGDPILVIAEKKPMEIVAYISQEQLAHVRETMVVQLVKSTEPEQVANSQVIRLGPTMELIPKQLWRSPNIEQWGRPVLIKIPPGMNLLPGEKVGIRNL